MVGSPGTGSVEWKKKAVKQTTGDKEDSNWGGEASTFITWATSGVFFTLVGLEASQLSLDRLCIRKEKEEIKLILEAKLIVPMQGHTGSYIKASRHEKRFSRDGASEMETVRAQAPDPRQ